MIFKYNIGKWHIGLFSWTFWQRWLVDTSRTCRRFQRNFCTLFCIINSYYLLFYIFFIFLFNTDGNNDAQIKKNFHADWDKYVGFFWEKNVKTVFGTAFPSKKLYSFLLSNPRHVAPKIIFCWYFGKNVVFFFEKVVKWKIFKTSIPTKKGICDVF